MKAIAERFKDEFQTELDYLGQDETEISIHCEILGWIQIQPENTKTFSIEGTKEQGCDPKPERLFSLSEVKEISQAAAERGNEGNFEATGMYCFNEYAFDEWWTKKLKELTK